MAAPAAPGPPAPGATSTPLWRRGRWQLNRVIVVMGGVVMVPLVALIGRFRPSAARRVAQATVEVFAGLCGVRFELVGVLPDAPCILVANHSSLLDAPALLATLPDVRFLAAADLYRIPVLASLLRAMGSVPVDRRTAGRGRGQIDELARAGVGGRLAIFPEGAIPAEGRLRFKTGGFQLAALTGTDICPVALVGTAAALPPRAGLAVRPGRIEVRILPRIPVTAGRSDRRTLRDHAESAVLSSLSGE